MTNRMMQNLTRMSLVQNIKRRWMRCGTPLKVMSPFVSIKGSIGSDLRGRASRTVTTYMGQKYRESSSRMESYLILMKMEASKKRQNGPMPTSVSQ